MSLPEAIFYSLCVIAAFTAVTIMVVVAIKTPPTPPRTSQHVRPPLWNYTMTEPSTISKDSK